MTLTKEQLDQLVAMLANLPFREAAPIMNFLQKILQEKNDNNKADGDKG